VLRAVASGNELQTVLLDIAQAAAGLFVAPWAGVFVSEGDEIGFYAQFSSPDVKLERRRWPRPNVRTSSLAEVLRDRSVVRFDDQSTLGDDYAQSRDAANRVGIKSSAYVPVPAGGAAVGVCVFRDVVDPFTDDDVALLQSFAAQAATAVENARRQQELRDALELQTATTEVLRLISTTPGDLDTVLARPRSTTWRGW
jgi:GAF domain-containing protein